VRHALLDQIQLLPIDQYAGVAKTTRRTSGRAVRVGFDDPNVTELDRHAVFLEHERAPRGFAGAAGGAGRPIEFLVVVDFHPVEEYGRPGLGDLVAAAVEPWRPEVDVEGLPLQRRAARPEARPGVLGAVVEARVRVQVR